jgi:hypothetical protein
METLIKSLTSHATAVLPVVIVCVLTIAGLFLLSRGYKSESQVALDSLFVIKNLLAAQLGEKGGLLVDIWIKGLQNIQDGEYSEADRIDTFVRFIKLAAAGKGIVLTEEDLQRIQTLVMTTLELFVGKKSTTIAVAVNKFNAMNVR